MSFTNKSLQTKLFEFCTKRLFERRSIDNMDEKSYIVWLAGTICAYLATFAAATFIGCFVPPTLPTLIACAIFALLGALAFRAGVSVREILEGNALLMIGVALPYGMLLHQQESLLPGLLPLLSPCVAMGIVAFCEPKSQHLVWKIIPSVIFYPIFGIISSLALCWKLDQSAMIWATSCLTSCYILGVYGFALRAVARRDTVADSTGVMTLLPLYGIFVAIQYSFRFFRASMEAIALLCLTGFARIMNFRLKKIATA